MSNVKARGPSLRLNGYSRIVDNLRFLQSMLQLQKHGRSAELSGRLGAILEKLKATLLGDQSDSGLVEDWIVAVGVYVMSVNKSTTQEEFSATLKSVWPVQSEPASLATKLRDEGIEIGEARGAVYGTIKTLQCVLGREFYEDAELRGLSQEELNSLVVDLRSKLLSRSKLLNRATERDSV